MLYKYFIQVAALALLALLLVLEARCAPFVIVRSASLAPTQHIILYKLVSEIIVIAMGVVPMSKVEGTWIWFYCYQVYVIQHLPTSNPHAHAHY